MTLEENKAKYERIYDKAMALQIPGTKPLEPIVKPKPPPAGYIRKSVEPSGGGELFETLLTTSTEIFKLVSNSGRNVVSMSTPITLLVEEGECDVNKLGEFGIETKKIGGSMSWRPPVLLTMGPISPAPRMRSGMHWGELLSQVLMVESQVLEVFTEARKRTSYV